MLKKTLPLLAVLSLTLLAIFTPVAAQEDDEGPMAYAILFYSPYCSHCEAFINNELPTWLIEFGDSFQLLFVDTSTESGRNLFIAVGDAHGILPERRGVPTMIIADQLFIGGNNIPENVPDIIRAGLAAGDGVPLPDFSGMQGAYEAALEDANWLEWVAPEPADADTVSDDASETVPMVEPLVETLTLGEKLAADPVANAMAVLVLLGSLVSVALILLYGSRGMSEEDSLNWLSGKPKWWAALATTGFGLVVAGTLIMQDASDSLATPLAWSVMVALLVVAGVLLYREKPPSWLVPLVVVAGLAAAVYLAQVEVSETEAICGAVGDCNAVQESEYAHLFGVIPIGVMGVAGYVAILLAWAVTRMTNDLLVNLAHVSLLGLALFGVGFSIYLTFLEPFVIGATCAWCLTSALVMLLLLWLVAADGWAALYELSGTEKAKKAEPKTA